MALTATSIGQGGTLGYALDSYTLSGTISAVQWVTVLAQSNVYVTESGNNYRICDFGQGGCSLWTTCLSGSSLVGSTATWICTIASPYGCASQVLLPSLGAAAGQTYYDCSSNLLATPFFTGTIYRQLPTSIGTMSTTPSTSTSTSVPSSSTITSPAGNQSIGPIIGGVLGGIVAICITVIVVVIIMRGSRQVRTNDVHRIQPATMIYQDDSSPHYLKPELDTSIQPRVTSRPNLPHTEVLSSGIVYEAP